LETGEEQGPIGTPAKPAGVSRGRLWARWLPPFGLATLIVATAPFLGVLRAWVRLSFGLGYLSWVSAGLAVAGLAALAWAILRIREHRALRYGALAMAAGLVALQVGSWSAGGREADVLERVHLLEYGLLAILFARAFRERHESRLLAVPVLLAVALASVADELVQWLTPVRVGDGRDVLLNLWAGAIGLLFGLALSGPRGLFRPPAAATWRLAAGLGAVAVLAGALFFDLAHLGYEVHDPRAGVFLSWHSPEKLVRAAADRARRWPVEGVPADRPLALEDRFRSEAGWHVNARNHAVTIGDLPLAWRENRILERWYGPFVDLPGNHWPSAQKEAIREELRASRPVALAPSPRYRSPTLAGRIVPGPPRILFWIGAAALAVGLGWPARRRGGRA
jgi:hypothetical protein